ncbi:glyoxalase [Clostridia bacterium]|nr:glyoxalase [Clostridia bacterium]
MKFLNPLIAVKDIEKSKQFYHDVLGLEVVVDFGANVTLTGGLALQSLDTWQGFIHKNADEITFGCNASEYYFEEDDIETFYEKLSKIADLVFVHKLIEHAWGQRVVRFYDLDKHIIEVGENMASVVKRFLDSGLSVQETALRMNVSASYVEDILK